jgi:D-beta-D-heptose 7-phosphate kinase/D-beta-D-heptose 1-phosphate adenosyltransferase
VSTAIPPSARILNRRELLERYRRPRTTRVVFTNGCFDVLHRGHVEYLFAARALGAALVVGVNTDASVRRLKGEGRPLNRELDRAFVLAGLACVDAVTLFEEDTPARLISELLPDILVKGGDYQPHQVVGRDVVEAAGGRLVIVPLVQGHSTSATLERMRTTP